MVGWGWGDETKLFWKPNSNKPPRLYVLVGWVTNEFLQFFCIL